MSSRTSDLVADVQSAHQFDVDSLLRYCSANVGGFPASPSRFSVSQFGHGQSNPTFLLEAVSGSSIKRYVMRKKPPGKILPSAHAVEREYLVLRALSNHTTVPVPKVFCLCTDPLVVGTPFYVMEYLEGRIVLDPKLPDMSPQSRRAMYLASARALASLHSANVDGIGLGHYGRMESYCARQIERWNKQYVSATSEGRPPKNLKMSELVNWLRHNVPNEDAIGSKSGLVHGDFRIDNLVFHPIEDRVIGILDWELSTLGNQMSDVAYSCLPYIINLALDSFDTEGLETTRLPDGIPSLPEYLSEYCSASGSSWPVSDWKFYVAFSMFRAASIYTGVYSRFLRGNASGGDRARHAGAKSDAVIGAALQFIQRRHVLPEKPQQRQRSVVDPDDDVATLRRKLLNFMEEHVYPVEMELYRRSLSSARWTIHPDEERLKDLAKQQGLWNLWIPNDTASRAPSFLPRHLLGAGLSNVQYAHLCEIMGRSVWAPQIFNCNAPDTGNMEVLLRYGNEKQMKEWLVPLLEGKIRSGFAMTEPQVSSSDATNIECSMVRDGDSYVINGTKWWTSGAMDPRCGVLIVMGKTDPGADRHRQQSMILVDMKSPGVSVKRPLTVFGYDDAPHGHAEIVLDNVRVSAGCIVLGEGRGFEIAQGRLGPGRLHHCMRLLGASERGMELMVCRARGRTAFGKAISDHGSFLSDLALCRMELEKTRLLVLEAARQLDAYGNVKARGALAMAKVAAPNTALRVLDMAIQVHGAAGFTSDHVLAHLWASARMLKMADGPDEVHLGTIAKLELRRAKL